MSSNKIAHFFDCYRAEGKDQELYQAGHHTDDYEMLTLNTTDLTPYFEPEDNTLPELVNRHFVPPTNYGTYLRNEKEDFQGLIAETLGFYQLSQRSRSNLKDDVRLHSHMLRSSINHIQSFLEDFLTDMFFEMFENLYKEKVKDTKRKNPTINAQDVFNGARVELKQLLHLETQEMQILLDLGMTFEHLVSLIFGDEYKFITKNVESKNETAKTRLKEKERRKKSDDTRKQKKKDADNSNSKNEDSASKK